MANPAIRSRVEFVDGARALAALYVLAHHAWAMLWPPALHREPTGALAVLTHWLSFGHLGVTVFIVLAGYSLAIAPAERQGHLRDGFSGFIRRRARRILPPYWVALLLSVIVALTLAPRATGTQWDLVVPFKPEGAVFDALLLQDVVQVQNANYAFWSIAIEFHIYFMFPIILLIWRRWGWGAGVAFGVGVGLAGIVLAARIPFLNQFWPVYYSAFALGVGARILPRVHSDAIRRLPWGIVGAVLAAAVCATVGAHDYPWLVAHTRLIDLGLAAGIALLLTSMTLDKPNPLRAVLSNPRIVAVGAFSYSIYLIHAPLLQLGWQYGVRFLPPDDGLRLMVMLLVVCPLVILCAWGFHLVAERPFLTSRRPHDAAGASGSPRRVRWLGPGRFRKRGRTGDVAATD